MPTMNDKETIKEYFTFLYNETHLSKTNFAKELNVSQAVVSNILTGGRAVSSNLIKAVYLKYGINLDTIENTAEILVALNTNKTTDKTIDNMSISGNLIKIPYFNVKAAAGDGIENFDSDPDDVYYFDKRILPRVDINNLSVITASGDSMDSGSNKNTDIKDGDLLIINHNETEPVDGGVYVLLVNNKDLRVKKIQINYNGCFKIVSNNHDYHTEIYNPQSKDKQFEIKIIGKVLWNGSKGGIK